MPEQRTEHLSTRVKPSELRDFRHAANLEGRTTSQMIRILMREFCGLPPDPEDLPRAA